MAQPFFDRLKRYFTEVGEVLRGQADVASIFPNTSDIGLSREHIYAEVLRTHLPTSCSVFLGGFLFDMKGHESKQIDLIILNDASLQFNFLNPDGSGKSFACIDGCVAAVSVKSRLDSTQLIEALENIASLPDKVPMDGRLNPLITIGDYEDWPFKVIYASDGVSLDTALGTVSRFYAEHPQVPVNKRPNVIHVCGKYNIIRLGKDAKMRDGTPLPENYFLGQPDPTDVFSLFFTVLRIQLRAQASSHLIYDYRALLDRLPLP